MVVVGIAERAISQAVFKIGDLDLVPLLWRRRRKKDEQRQLEQQILPVAIDQVEELLVDKDAPVAVLASRGNIERAIRELLRTTTIPEHIEQGEGRRFFSARTQAAQGILAHIRSTGAQSILLDIGKKVMIRQPGRRSDPSPC